MSASAALERKAAGRRAPRLLAIGRVGPTVPEFSFRSNFCVLRALIAQVTRLGGCWGSGTGQSPRQMRAPAGV